MSSYLGKSRLAQLQVGCRTAARSLGSGTPDEGKLRRPYRAPWLPRPGTSDCPNRRPWFAHPNTIPLRIRVECRINLSRTEDLRMNKIVWHLWARDQNLLPIPCSQPRRPHRETLVLYSLPLFINAIITFSITLDNAQMERLGRIHPFVRISFYGISKFPKWKLTPRLKHASCFRNDDQNGRQDSDYSSVFNTVSSSRLGYQRSDEPEYSSGI